MGESYFSDLKTLHRKQQKGKAGFILKVKEVVSLSVREKQQLVVPRVEQCEVQLEQLEVVLRCKWTTIEKKKKKTHLKKMKLH